MKEAILNAINRNGSLLPKLKMLYRGKGNTNQERLDSISDKQIEGMHKLPKADGNV